MSRFVDRCLLLVAGGMLGFLAARGPQVADHRPADAGDGAAAPAVDASPAAPPAVPPVGDPTMEQIVNEVVRLRPDERRRARGPLTEEEIDACLVVAEDVNPDLHRGLLALREADPDEFRRRLATSERLRFLAELRADEPHLYELKMIELRTDREVERLSDQLRAAAARGDARAIDALRPQLVTQMRMQQAFILLARKQALDRMREKLESFDRRYQQDLATVDERIRARVDAIIAAAGAESAEPRGEGPDDRAAGGASPARESGRRR